MDAASRSTKALLSSTPIPLLVTLLVVHPDLLLAAKPTDAFKKNVEATWRKVPYSRMTGKSGEVQTWAVVLREGLSSAVPATLVQGGAYWAGDLCYQMVHSGGVLSAPEPEKQLKRKVVRPVEPGTVLRLLDVSFKDKGVELYVSDRGQPITRETGGGKGSVSGRENFCLLLQFSDTPSAGAKLDAVDAPRVMASMESLLKPFASEAAADEFAATLRSAAR